MPEPRVKTILLPLLIALVAAVVLGWTLSGAGQDDAGSPTSGGGSAGTSARTGDDPASGDDRASAGDPMAMGDPDAPVVMVSYSDFQCPFCGKFARETEPELVEKYVDTGVLRIEWRDFPYLGEESLLAARAGRAAAEQDEFWAFHDAMYADQPAPNSGAIDEQRLEQVAGEVGLDVERFLEDLADERLVRGIEEDFAAGQAAGVTGTPAFVIDGQLVMGAQPLPIFEQAIERAAEQAGG